MIGYIYNIDTNELVCEIHGVDNNDIENTANEMGYMGCDEYYLSYNSEFYFSTHNDCNDPEHGGCGACER